MKPDPKEQERRSRPGYGRIEQAKVSRDTHREPVQGPHRLDPVAAAFRHLERGDALSPRQRAIVEQVEPGAVARDALNRQIRSLSPDQKQVLSVAMSLLPNKADILIAVMQQIAAMYPTQAMVEAIVKRSIPGWVRNLSAQGPQDGAQSVATWGQGWANVNDLVKTRRMAFRVIPTGGLNLMYPGKVYVGGVEAPWSSLDPLPTADADAGSVGSVEIKLTGTHECSWVAGINASTEDTEVWPIFTTVSGELIQLWEGDIHILPASSP